MSQLIPDRTKDPMKHMEQAKVLEHPIFSGEFHNDEMDESAERIA